MDKNAKAMVMANFLADSFAPGAHWGRKASPRTGLSQLRKRGLILELLENIKP